jgi:hypothetical protein
LSQTGSISTNSTAVMNSLVRAAEQDTEKSVKLLKKAMASDADIVSKLLPIPSFHEGKVNLAA